MGTLTRQKKIIKRVRNYVMITVAAFIYAISISLFLDPNNIAPGGITGVAILINRFTNIPTGTLNLILNVPIVLLGLLKFRTLNSLPLHSMHWQQLRYLPII